MQAKPAGAGQHFGVGTKMSSGPTALEDTQCCRGVPGLGSGSQA